MGLDISAYRQVKIVPLAKLDEYGYPKDYNKQQVVRFNPDFKSHGKGLENGLVYDLGTERMGFRAGSYRGYNNWREQLAQLAGYPAVDVDRYGVGNIQKRHDQGAWNAVEGPFWELINFSDCEGVIGPIVCEKLAKDFAEFDKQAEDLNDQYFYDKYKEWRQAFDMASDGGFVDFH